MTDSYIQWSKLLDFFFLNMPILRERDVRVLTSFCVRVMCVHASIKAYIYKIGPPPMFKTW